MKKVRNIKTIILATVAAVGLPGVATTQVQVGGEVITDTEIVDTIKRRIMIDPVVNSGVWIVSDDGVVTLTGQVKSLFEKRRAGQIAAGKVGVSTVINNLEIETASIADTELKARVQRIIAADPVLRTAGVEVAVSDGTVVISGAVDNWSIRNYIENAMTNVAGVTIIDNRSVVTPVTEFENPVVKEQIEVRMRADALVDSSTVDVMVSGGEVTLTGVVSNLREWRRAVDNSYVPGVTEVNADNLKIVYSPPQQVETPGDYVALTDAEIAGAIATALALTPSVDLDKIEITANDGKVELSGKVNTIRARLEAYQIAMDTSGVVDVVNSLVVAPSGTMSDSDLAAAVEDALLLDPYTEARDIGILTNAGSVTLSGKAETPFERARAEDVVAGIEGVVSVQNNIELSVASTSTTEIDKDLATKEAIEQELRWVPGNVEVSVNEGKVMLKGTVNSFYNRKRVENIAFFEGADVVINELAVVQ